MERLRHIPIHPILFVAFPTFFLLSENISEIRINQIWEPLIFSVVLANLVWSVINFIIQNRKLSAVTTSVLLLMFFSYVHVDRIFVWAHIPAAFYILIMIGFSLLITIRIKKSNLKLVKTTLILNIISLTVLIFPSLLISYYEIKRVGETTWSDLPFSSQERREEVRKPDVYYIITDSYASNSSLRDYFNFDNSEFTDYLKGRGFYIADKSRSNYPFTTPSVASSLNMSYLDKLTEEIRSNSKDATPLIKMTEDNRVSLYLKSQGYKYYHFGPRLLPTSLNKNADANYTYESNQIAMSPLTGLLIEQTILSHLVSSVDCTSSTSIFCIGSLNNRKGHYNYILDQIGKVGDVVEQVGTKFVFYHNLLTHVPYVFTEDGRYVSRSVEGLKKMEENYITQLKFTNNVLKQLIETILNDSENPPVIILQSDEGPYPDDFRKDTANFEWRQATKDELREKFGILNAYYLPGVETKNVLYPEITPVNSFRIVFNEYFKEQLPKLDDFSYAQTKYHNLYDVFDVTNLMK